jgi:hypothetical protein
MPFEVRIENQPVHIAQTEEEALRHAREAIRARPDCEPEIFDIRTGRPMEPAASKSARDTLANEIGY